MYTFELHALHSGNVQREALQMIEDISEEFQLQDNFGFISLATHELIEQVIQLYSEEESEITLEFNLYQNQLSILLHHSSSLSSLKELMENVDLHYDSSLFIIQQLSDVIEFDNDDQKVKISFHVKPVFNHIQNRMQNSTSDSSLKEEKIEGRDKMY